MEQKDLLLWLVCSHVERETKADQSLEFHEEGTRCEFADLRTKVLQQLVSFDDLTPAERVYFERLLASVRQSFEAKRATTARSSQKVPSVSGDAPTAAVEQQGEAGPLISDKTVSTRPADPASIKALETELSRTVQTQSSTDKPPKLSSFLTQSSLASFSPFSSPRTSPKTDRTLLRRLMSQEEGDRVLLLFFPLVSRSHSTSARPSPFLVPPLAPLPPLPPLPRLHLLLLSLVALLSHVSLVSLCYLLLLLLVD